MNFEEIVFMDECGFLEYKEPTPREIFTKYKKMIIDSDRLSDKIKDMFRAEGTELERHIETLESNPKVFKSLLELIQVEDKQYSKETELFAQTIKDTCEIIDKNKIKKETRKIINKCLESYEKSKDVPGRSNYETMKFYETVFGMIIQTIFKLEERTNCAKEILKYKDKLIAKGIENCLSSENPNAEDLAKLLSYY